MYKFQTRGSFSKADANYTMNLNGVDNVTVTSNYPTVSDSFAAGCTSHSIGIDAGDNNTGTIAFFGKSLGAEGYEALLDADGVAITIDLSTTTRTVGNIQKYGLIAMSFTHTTLGGANNVVYTVLSGE
jgi:hypothetical protein